VAFLMTHFYEGGTAEQYQAVLEGANRLGVSSTPPEARIMR